MDSIVANCRSEGYRKWNITHLEAEVANYQMYLRGNSVETARPASGFLWKRWRIEDGSAKSRANDNRRMMSRPSLHNFSPEEERT